MENTKAYYIKGGKGGEQHKQEREPRGEKKIENCFID